VELRIKKKEEEESAKGSPNKHGDTTKTICENDEGSQIKDEGKIGDHRDHENQSHEEQGHEYRF
jgi:hypothetical protein